MINACEAELHDELKQARESTKTVALLQSEHQQLVDQFEKLKATNRELQEQVDSFYSKMSKSQKRHAVAIVEWEKREAKLMGHLKTVNETLIDACPKLEEEARRAALRLWALSQPAEAALETFWMPELMSSCVVTLEDRLLQVKSLVQRMKSASQDLCTTLWPNEEASSSIFALVDKLTQGSAEVEKWKESAARSGAGMALAMVLTHHPDTDVDSISAGAPLNAEDQPIDPLELLPPVRRIASRIAGLTDLEERVEATPEE